MIPSMFFIHLHDEKAGSKLTWDPAPRDLTMLQERESRSWDHSDGRGVVSRGTRRKLEMEGEEVFRLLIYSYLLSV